MQNIYHIEVHGNLMLTILFSLSIALFLRAPDGLLCSAFFPSLSLSLCARCCGCLMEKCACVYCFFIILVVAAAAGVSFRFTSGFNHDHMRYACVICCDHIQHKLACDTMDAPKFTYHIFVFALALRVCVKTIQLTILQYRKTAQQATV